MPTVTWTATGGRAEPAATSPPVQVHVTVGAEVTQDQLVPEAVAMLSSLGKVADKEMGPLSAPPSDETCPVAV